jgi:DNA-binding MarR family transcriptional regulator
MAKEKAEAADIIQPLERLTRLMRAGEHEGGFNPAQWEALRYLARANRFSNSPGALTRFLGTTKGTVSQTLKSLERKGMIVKSRRVNERRSVCLELTDGARNTLNTDPLKAFSKSVEDLNGKTKRRLAKSLREFLEIELTRQKQPSFGTCSSCRYFREKGRDQSNGGPHACMLFEVALTGRDTTLICVEHS